MVQSAQANAANSALLRLPAELRVKIWRLTLSGNTIRPYIKASSYKLLELVKAKFVKPDIRRFGLLWVCRQTYIECAVLPYTLSTFAFQRLPDVLMWMDIMSPHEIVLVRNIGKLRFRHKPVGSLDSLHDRFSGLEEMKMHLDTYYDPDITREEQERYEQRHGVAVEVIHAAVCDWLTQWATGDLDAKCQSCKEFDHQNNYRVTHSRS